MGKQNIYTCNGYYAATGKTREILILMQCYKDEPWAKHYAKWNKPDAKGWILYDSTYMIQWAYQGWRGGGGSYFLMGMRFLSEMMTKL